MLSKSSVYEWVDALFRSNSTKSCLQQCLQKKICNQLTWGLWQLLCKDMAKTYCRHMNVNEICIEILTHTFVPQTLAFKFCRRVKISFLVILKRAVGEWLLTLLQTMLAATQLEYIRRVVNCSDQTRLRRACASNRFRSPFERQCLCTCFFWNTLCIDNL